MKILYPSIDYLQVILSFNDDFSKKYILDNAGCWLFDLDDDIDFSADGWFVIAEDGNCAIFDSQYNVVDMSFIGYVFPNNVVQEYNAKKVIVPHTIKKIQPYAFKHSSVEEVELPSSIEKIGFEAFSYCKQLRSIDLASTTITRIEKNAFCHCSSLEEVKLPNIIFEMKSGAFLGCKNLMHINFPKKLKSIGAGAFNGCSMLENILLPTTLKKIEAFAFFSCDSLISITLPRSVEIILDFAFANCKNLEEVIVLNSNISVTPHILDRCSNMQCLIVNSKNITARNSLNKIAKQFGVDLSIVQFKNI